LRVEGRISQPRVRSSFRETQSAPEEGQNYENASKESPSDTLHGFVLWAVETSSPESSAPKASGFRILPYSKAEQNIYCELIQTLQGRALIRHVIFVEGNKQS
jgi:hypothetical protein